MPRKTLNKPLDLEKTIMGKVKSNEIQMKPRWYFLVGSLLMLIGVVSSSIAASFLFNLTFFLFRTHGPMGEQRYQLLLATFPWWVPLLALASIALGAVLLKQYDFSYKNNFWLIVSGFILSVIISASILDGSGFNDTWSRRGPMKGMYGHFEGQREFRKYQYQQRDNSYSGWRK